MAELEFRELRGDYVANTGQTINLRQYLDYFEPLGSALSRLPDGTGGPFVHQFTDGGGRTIGSIGWVVSAASKRFGAWTLWGMWTDRAIPPVALPLFWSALSDPSRTSEVVSRANEKSEKLFDRKRWPKLLEEVQTQRLRDRGVREALEAELAHAWAVPPPHKHAIEVELPPQRLDVLPWLYILGPVDPSSAQLLPSRFNGAGYQYILGEQRLPSGAAALAFDAGELIDTAASDVVAGWRMAHELRAQRGRPSKRIERPLPKPKLPPPPLETKEMQSETPPSSLPTEKIITIAYRVLVLALLGWIAWNVAVIRKAVTATPDTPQTVATSTTESAPEPEPAPPPEPPRVQRLAAALAAKPPRNIRINDAALKDVTEEQLGRVAIEIFLRRNTCYARTEAADGKLSAAELKAMRSCAAVKDEGLVKTNGQPDFARALDWLERILAG